MITKFPENGVFFTSDTHFNHRAIVNLCKRPFNSIEEHDQALIDNWNSVGDFCFGGFPKWKEIRSQLNGHIILIRGNHDDKNMSNGCSVLFDHDTYQMRININGRNVYLNHFPFLCFAHGDINLYKDSYSIQLYGHCHSGPNSASADLSRLNFCYPTQYDVGVDNNNYTPVSWEQIKDIINKQICYERND